MEEALQADCTPLEARLAATGTTGEPERSGAVLTTAERRQRLLLNLLGILNESADFAEAIRGILRAVKRETGCDAVGIRLRSGSDFPYFVQDGFSTDFLLNEDTLAVRSSEGGPCREAAGSIGLECTCGLVLSGKTDPSNPLFTTGGSFWTNDSSSLLTLPPEQDPRLNPRNRCIHEGYASVVLIPVRANREIVGLLQLNDRAKNRFTLETVHFFEQIGACIGAALVRRQMEEALRVSELRYRMLFESMQEGFYIGEVIRDDAGTPIDYAYLDVNPAFEKILGLRREQIIGKKLKELTPQVSSQWLETFLGVTLTGMPYESDYYSNSLRRHFNVKAYRPLEGQFAVLLEDITERKKAEEKLQKIHADLEETIRKRTAALEKLEEANRELDSFAYSISHDLRAPLRAIDGFSRMLAKKTADRLDAEERRRFDTIRDNVRKMEQLIDAVLAFSRLGRQAMSCSAIDMHGVAQQVWEELLAVNADRRIAFTLERLPAAVGDPALIRQVLVNLLSNAVKYTRKRDSAVIVVGTAAANGEQVYYVRDNGAGFDMKYYEKLFGLFQRLHSPDEFEGNGAGLSIVKRIVQRHGGRIWAEGEPDKGATFYFTLPAPNE